MINFMWYSKTIYSVIFITLMFNIYGQNSNIKITAAKPFLVQEREIPISLVSSDSLGTFFLYSKGKYGRAINGIKKFNKLYEPTNINIELSEELERKEYALGTLKRNKKLYNVIAKVTKEEKSFFAQTIDLVTNEVSSRIKIASIAVKDKNAKKIFSRFLFGNDDDFGLIYKLSDKKAKQEKYRFSRIDTNLNIVDNYDLILPSDKHYLTKIFWTARDTFYLVTADEKNVFNPSSNRVPNSNFKILQYVKGEFQKEFIVDGEGVFIGNYTLDIKPKTIAFIALYSRTSRYNLKGSYFKSFEIESGLSLKKSVVPFDQKVIDQHKAQKDMGGDLMRILKNKNELPYYVVRQYLPFPNGKTLILSEQTHTMTAQYVTTYYYKNILAVMIDKEGNQLWTKMIKKNNSKTNTSIFSGYLVYKRENSCVLMYNDNILNLKKDDPKLYRTFDGVDRDILITTFISENGEINSQSHKIEELLDYRIRPRLSNSIGKGKLLLFTQRPSNVKQQAFVTVEFQD